MTASRLQSALTPIKLEPVKLSDAQRTAPHEATAHYVSSAICTMSRVLRWSTDCCRATVLRGKSGTATIRAKRRDSVRTMQRLLVAILLLSSAAPVCVFGQSAFSSSFDHFTTGFVLDGAHLTADCETCHVGGVFQGTPLDCRGCHSLGGRIDAEAKPVDHVLSNDFCDDCHRTASWVPLAQMNHDAVYGTCETCHNNVYTVGKPPGHPLTQADCDMCHATARWRPARFDHFGISSNCVSCHDNVDATGKNAAHITTTNTCEDCHNTTVFAPASRVDHTQVLGVCASCHNTVVATGKPPDHIPSSDNCNTCHTTAAWIPAQQ